MWCVQFIAGDPDKDIAVLQLQCPEEKAAELKPVTLGTSANLLVGQKVFALGNPFGLDHSMTQVHPHRFKTSMAVEVLRDLNKHGS